MPALAIREDLAPDGKSPFARWFAELDATAGARVVLLLGGGSKASQAADIQRARARWAAYRRAKSGDGES